MQCCPISDGAAAVVLCSQKEARRRRRTVGVKAAILCTGSYDNPADLDRWETDYRGCNQGYEAAGIGPEDLHVVECHDAFTIAEILHYEALGLCGPGEGANLAVRGETRLGGRIPVNVSGGLIGRGHPPGATGLAQVHEIVTQLRGEGGARQVRNAKVGLAHCMGGDKDGDTKSFTMIVLVS
jgi:acetyl-CoA acetyltransferase